MLPKGLSAATCHNARNCRAQPKGLQLGTCAWACCQGVGCRVRCELSLLLQQLCGAAGCLPATPPPFPKTKGNIPTKAVLVGSSLPPPLLLPSSSFFFLLLPSSSFFFYSNTLPPEENNCLFGQVLSSGGLLTIMPLGTVEF